MLKPPHDQTTAADTRLVVAHACDWEGAAFARAWVTLVRLKHVWLGLAGCHYAFKRPSFLGPDESCI
jgi:hypothetical protein